MLLRSKFCKSQKEGIVTSPVESVINLLGTKEKDDGIAKMDADMMQLPSREINPVQRRPKNFETIRSDATEYLMSMYSREFLLKDIFTQGSAESISPTMHSYWGSRTC